LFLKTIDLDDLAVLDDHADLAEAYAPDGRTHPLEIELAREDRESLAGSVRRGQDFLSHGCLALSFGSLISLGASDRSLSIRLTGNKSIKPIGIVNIKTWGLFSSATAPTAGPGDETGH
jgi:hypothetical protein